MRTARALLVAVLAGAGLAACGVGPGAAFVIHPLPTLVERWLALTPSYAAHRGGSADWPEGTARAYQEAAAWSPDLALEAPVWQTADGVWVVCHEPTTGSVFDADLDIGTSTWDALSRLRTLDGDLPMARLDEVLAAHPYRVFLVDDKPNVDVDGLLDLLDASGGPGHVVLKSFYTADVLPQVARARGYRTWGYYYPADAAEFAATQGRWDVVALAWNAPAADWRAALATGKPVFGHIVATEEQARVALVQGASGLMVSGVTDVVPH